MQFNKPKIWPFGNTRKAILESRGYFKQGQPVKVKGFDIEADGVVKAQGRNSVLVEIDGKQEWFPLSCVEVAE